MQHNLSLYKQTTGQKKLFENFIYISKIVPRDLHANESNFEKIDLWRILHANRSAKTPSTETSVAKELVSVILRL